MFFLRKPDLQSVLAVQQAAKEAPFTYSDLGMTKNFQSFSDRYIVDHHRFLLGSGEGIYEKAKGALSDWRQFELDWVTLTKPASELSPGGPGGEPGEKPGDKPGDTPSYIRNVEVGDAVCLTVQLAPLWLLFGCRVVYVLDEERSQSAAADNQVKRSGYAYGTLAGHPERGEECFSVEWNRSNNEVWYDIVALSQPGNLLVTLAKPFARKMQARFARESGAAMQKACRAD